MMLFYGLAAATFAIAIAEDAYTKLVFIDVVEEKSAQMQLPKLRSFMKPFEKYHGEIQYKVVNPVTTTFGFYRLPLCRLKTA